MDLECPLRRSQEPATALYNETDKVNPCPHLFSLVLPCHPQTGLTIGLFLPA